MEEAQTGLSTEKVILADTSLQGIGQGASARQIKWQNSTAKGLGYTWGTAQKLLQRGTAQHDQLFLFGYNSPRT